MTDPLTPRPPRALPRKQPEGQGWTDPFADADRNPELEPERNEELARDPAVNRPCSDVHSSRGTSPDPSPTHSPGPSTSPGPRPRPSARRGPDTSRPGLSGATLFYPSATARPDLFLTAQILIEDLRAEGWQMSGLRISDHLLRVRLAGMELALARSDRPLPPAGLRGLVRPRRLQSANSTDRPAPGAQAAPDSEQDPEQDPGDTATDVATPLTDLGQVRVTRALRQHQSALGVLLRRRGTQGPADLDAALLTILRTVAEAAPPALVLWQRTGVVMTPAEFAACAPADLARPGDPARPIQLGTPRNRPLPVAAARASPPAPPPSPGALGRQARAARRSAGRVFGHSDHGGVILPRIETAAAGLAAVFRAKDTGAVAENQAPSVAQQVARLAVVALWCTLILPGGAGLRAVLPL